MHLEDKKKSLLLFWTVFIVYILIYMTKSCFGAAMAAIVDAGVLTKSQTGLISAVFYLVYAPLQIVGGIAVDRYNPERLIKIGIIGAAIANGIVFFTQNYIVMLVAWTFNAVAQFAIWPGVFKIVSSQLAPDHRPRAAFLISFSASSGILVAYLVAAAVKRWQDNFAISAMVLLACVIVLHIVTRHVEPYMVPDRVPRGIHTNEPIKLVNHNMSTATILSLGCVFLMTVKVMLRAAVENGYKTLSATMLMESYEHITPSIGNLLNALVIVSGIAGLIFARYVLFPRIFKDEIACTFFLIALSTPLCALIHFVGQINEWIVIACLCIISMLLNGTQYLLMNYTMRFSKYGLNGTVAGINNAGGAIGLVIQNYLFAVIAEEFGWAAVADTSLIFIGATALCMLIAIPIWKKFKNLEHDEETVEA